MWMLMRLVRERMGLILSLGVVVVVVVEILVAATFLPNLCCKLFKEGVWR